MNIPWRTRHLIGISIILMTLFITLTGQWLAPHDQRERLTVLITADAYLTPPFPIGTPGHWLGSDQYGRDLLSRLLVGTRPTMLAIGVVALLRVFIGVALGSIMVFGSSLWAAVGAVVYRIITIIPVFLSALLTLVFVGSHTDLWVFLVALTWSGWGEVAQYVEARAREFREQPVYEAARSGGSSHISIVLFHLLRLLTPALPALLLREIGNTLVVLAGLGFLGYYVGGTAWVIVAGDAVPVGARTADYAELGQLLATSYERVLHPEGLIVVGTYLAIITLGIQFWLDRLWQQRLMPARTTDNPITTNVRFAYNWWANRNPTPWLWGIVAVSVVGITISVIQRTTPPQSSTSVLPAPVVFVRTHPWGQGNGDAAQSLTGAIPVTAPTPAQAIIAPVPLTSAAIVAADGSLVVYADHELLIHTPDQRWVRIAVKYPFVGTPALTSQSHIVTVGVQGLIRHYTLSGELVAEYGTTTRAQATSGAVVTPDDLVIVTVVDRLEAFRDGTLVWHTPAVASYAEYPAVVAPAGDLVFLGNTAFDISDGGRLPQFGSSDAQQFENPTFVSGADGYVYHRNGHHLYQLAVSGLSSESINDIWWEANRVTLFYPDQSGINRSGTAWHTYKGYGGQARLVWVYGADEFQQQPIDADMRIYVSDPDSTRLLGCTPHECRVYDPDASTAWEYRTTSAQERIIGVASAPTGILITQSNTLQWLLDKPPPDQS